MKLLDNLMNSFPPPPPLPLTSPTSLSVNWQPIFYGLLYTLLVKIDSPSVPPDVNVIPKNSPDSPPPQPMNDDWSLSSPEKHRRKSRFQFEGKMG